MIGILGGMYSGKSTVAAELAKLGCAVIDADSISHQLLEEKDVLKKIVRVFGKEILDNKGKIDRSALANRVFGDPAKLETLTGILHPLVMARVEQLITQCGPQPAVRAIALDIPLLVEVGWEKRCDHIIFVDCAPPLRLERAKKTGVFDADQLKIRENLQISLDKKKRIADNIVDNNSDLSGLSKQIACIFSTIVDKG
ncbi:MAG: dephospho-CoA kinase [Sedimentisphaerales bacterium]